MSVGKNMQRDYTLQIWQGNHSFNYGLSIHPPFYLSIYPSVIFLSTIIFAEVGNSRVEATDQDAGVSPATTLYDHHKMPVDSPTADFPGSFSTV